MRLKQYPQIPWSVAKAQRSWNVHWPTGICKFLLLLQPLPRWVSKSREERWDDSKRLFLSLQRARPWEWVDTNAKWVCLGWLLKETEVTYIRGLPGTILRRDLEPKVPQEVKGYSEPEMAQKFSLVLPSLHSCEVYSTVLLVNVKSVWKEFNWAGMALPGPLGKYFPSVPHSKWPGWIMGSMRLGSLHGSNTHLVKLNYISKCSKEAWFFFNDKINDLVKWMILLCSENNYLFYLLVWVWIFTFFYCGISSNIVVS